MRLSRKQLGVHASRGFESHPLRHQNGLAHVPVRQATLSGRHGASPLARESYAYILGEMAELADGAALEMLYRGNPVVGSNPTLSAVLGSLALLRRLFIA